jgi:AIPR protein
MELTDFRAEFLNRVAVRAATDRDFKHMAFVAETEQILVDAGEVSNLERAYYRREEVGHRHLAIDAYAFDDADDSLRVFVAVPGLEPEPITFDRAAAEQQLNRLTAFVDEAASGRLHRDMEPSDPAYAAAQEISERRDIVSRVRAYLLTDGELRSRTKDWPEGHVAGIPIEYHIWDIERLFRVQTAQSGREELVVDLVRWDGGLPCVPTGHVSDDYRAYLCVVPGATLAQLYEEHGSRLLEGNVRSFLAMRGRINKGIRNTILHTKDMFFAYNNGIAATAIDADVRKGPDGVLRLRSVTDLQIVNGGQTTASLATASRVDKADLTGIFVPMKLSIVSAAKATEMIPNIARFANTQNRVNEADFFSNHEYHRRLEGFSRRLLVPARPGAQYETKWFYERSRGQYGNETFKSTAAQRKRFEETYPKSQVFAKTDLAKSEMSWRQLPHIASLGAQKNFIKFAEYIAGGWDSNEDQFNEHYYRSVVARVILFRTLEVLVSKQPWYSGGYRANVVYYAMAKLAQLMRSVGRSLDTEAIWRTQAVSPELLAELTLITRAMHEVITDPEPGVQNVTEWAKREACWRTASAIPLHLSPAVAGQSLSARDALEVERVAVQKAKMDDGIGAQSAVFALGAEYWSEVHEWASARNFLSPQEESLLVLAARMPDPIPSDRQSKTLLALKERFELEGLAPRQIPES